MKFRFKLFKAIPWIAVPLSFVALFLMMIDVVLAGFILSAISAALAAFYLFAYDYIIEEGDYDE